MKNIQIGVKMMIVKKKPEEIRQAFEIEDISSRKNFTFEYDPILKMVIMHNTSRGVGKRFDFAYKEVNRRVYGDCLSPIDDEGQYKSGFTVNPLNCKTAWEYFQKLRIKPTDGRHFILGFVDPDTIQPLDEEDFYYDNREALFEQGSISLLADDGQKFADYLVIKGYNFEFAEVISYVENDKTNIYTISIKKPQIFEE
jgi:hypothetical protein